MILHPPGEVEPPPQGGLTPDGRLVLHTPRVFLPLLKKGPKYKGAKGGRGSGKSHFFAEGLIEECIADPTTRAMCVREIQNSLSESVKKLLETKIEALGVEAYFEVLETVIHVLDDAGRRRGMIIFIGMQNHTAKSIKSLEGFRIAWVEEAQSISQRSWDLLYPTIREAGGEIWLSWNPERADDPVESFMCGEGYDPKTGKHSDPDIVVVFANYYDNPWFWSTSLANDMRRDHRRDKDKFRHIWLGEYLTRSKASVFSNWQVIDFETPEDVERFYYGADWGFSVDPSCLMRCFIGRLVETGVDDLGEPTYQAVWDPSGDAMFIDHEAWKVGCEIDHLPALFAGDCPERWVGHNGGPLWGNEDGWPGVPGALSWPITADSARPETISYMRKRRFKIHPALKGPGSVEDGIEFLKSFDLVIHPRCVNVAREVALYSYKVDPKTEEILPVLADKDNHTIDSLRYATENLSRARRMRIRDRAVFKTGGRPVVDRQAIGEAAGQPTAPAPRRTGLGISVAALERTSR